MIKRIPGASQGRDVLSAQRFVFSLARVLSVLCFVLWLASMQSTVRLKRRAAGDKKGAHLILAPPLMTPSPGPPVTTKMNDVFSHTGLD